MVEAVNASWLSSDDTPIWQSLAAIRQHDWLSEQGPLEDEADEPPDDEEDE